MLFAVTPVDRRVYREVIADVLPHDIIDVHTHVWLKSFIPQVSEPRDLARTVSWPGRVAEDNSIEDLIETYRLLFPDKAVTPVIFGSPHRDVNLAETNAYVSRSAQAHGLPRLLVTTPGWSAQQLEREALEGGFLGLKPYLSFAPPHISADDITIFDYLPHVHLEVAAAHRWVVLLHIPRPARLRDPVNLAQLLEIERRYPNVRLIVAHIGRAYCREDVGKALKTLAETSRMRFDFSANTNAWVMTQLIRAVGPQRLLFGSDLPILRMRMRRVCENGNYVNLVPAGLYGDVSTDRHMREVTGDEADRLSFFMYEELRAFQEAAEATNLTTADLADIFYNNAASLFGLI